MADVIQKTQGKNLHGTSSVQRVRTYKNMVLARCLSKRIERWRVSRRNPTVRARGSSTCMLGMTWNHLWCCRWIWCCTGIRSRGRSWVSTTGIGCSSNLMLARLGRNWQNWAVIGCLRKCDFLIWGIDKF